MTAFLIVKTIVVCYFAFTVPNVFLCMLETLKYRDQDNPSLTSVQFWFFSAYRKKLRNTDKH
jgi:hypothetical protein